MLVAVERKLMMAHGGGQYLLQFFFFFPVQMHQPLFFFLIRFCLVLLLLVSGEGGVAGGCQTVRWRLLTVVLTGRRFFYIFSTFPFCFFFSSALLFLLFPVILFLSLSGSLKRPLELLPALFFFFVSDFLKWRWRWQRWFWSQWFPLFTLFPPAFLIFSLPGSSLFVLLSFSSSFSVFPVMSVPPWFSSFFFCRSPPCSSFSPSIFSLFLSPFSSLFSSSFSGFYKPKNGLQCNV